MQSPSHLDVTSPETPLDGSPGKSRKRQKGGFAESLIDEVGEENVKVCIRVRPFNNREMELQRLSSEKGPLRSVVAMPEGMAGKVVCYEKPANSSEYRLVEEFQYSKSFWSIPEDQQPHMYAPVSQEDVYDAIGRPIIRFAFAGFHNCVFAYGQTGSGKTHSMMGDFQGVITPLAGLIPRLCVELFEKVDAQKAEHEEGIIKSSEVRLSAIEIYNEQVRDLFWKLTPGRTKQQQLKIRKHPVDGSFFVDQLTVLKPSSWLECLRMIEKAVAERTVAATDMNDESSRSHCIFQLVLEQSETVHIVSEDPDERYTKPVTNKKISKINLVDLAGSERLKKSNAQGQQLKEAAGINLSLTTLKKVIDALVANSKEINPKKQVLVPFRESSLTLLLSDSLGGNSKTTMVACVSPHYDNQEETLLTLRYANRTGTIVNHARVNEDSAAKQALKLKHEILELQRRLAEGPVDEEADDLQDRIEIGRRSLKEMEEAGRKVANAAEELRRKAKLEEEARLSSAFYNSMKMALLQQQREQMDASANEMEMRIRGHREEADTLTAIIRNNEEEERIQVKQLEKLRKEAQAQRLKELEQDRQNSKLSREAQETQRKMEKEIELRYAQKMVNAYRLRKARAQCEARYDMLLKEQETKLTEVISEAAEQYELQVRQFADAETIVHQRTTKLEKEIQQFTSKREDAENEASRLMLKMRAAERAHNDTILAIEREWKEKYQTLKDDYEKKIAEMDQSNFEAQNQFEIELESSSKEVSVEQQALIKKLEAQVREAESLWNGKVAHLVEEKADEMDALLKAQRESHAIAAAKKRKEYECRIGDLVAQLQRVQALEVEHDTCSEQLEKAVAPLMHLHDAISLSTSDGNISGLSNTSSSDQSTSIASLTRRFAGYSPTYIALRRRLVRFDGNVSTATPLYPSQIISGVVVEGAASPSRTPQRLPIAGAAAAASPMTPNVKAAFDASSPLVFPVTPVNRVKLRKTTYADARANLSAAVHHSALRSTVPIEDRSASPLMRRPSSSRMMPSSSASPSGSANLMVRRSSMR